MPDAVRITRAPARTVGLVKRMADRHKRELGFILHPALLEASRAGELLVARNGKRPGIVGFVSFHHRLDGTTTIHAICVTPERRGRGCGRALVSAVCAEAHARGQSAIRLKCPVDLEANAFYAQLGFARSGVVDGRRRRLVVWSFDLMQRQTDHER